MAKNIIDVLLQVNDKMSGGLTHASKSISAHSKTWARASKQITKAGKSISKVGKGMTKSITVPVVAAAGAATKAFMGYEDAMAEVAAFSGLDSSTKKGAAALDQLGKKAIEVSNSMVFSATDVTDAYSTMALAGYNTEQMLDAITGTMQLAGLAGEDVSATTATLTATMSAFGDATDQASHYADLMATVSTNTMTDVGDLAYAFKNVATQAGTLGYSVDDVSVALGAMAQKGISGATAGVNLSKVFTRMATNDAAKKQLDKLGIAMFDSAGKARPLNQVLGDLRESFKGMSQEEAAAAAYAIGGQSAQKGLLAVVQTEQGEWDKLTESVKNAGGAAEDLYSTKTDTLSAKLDVLKGNVENLGIKFGEKLAPTIEKVSNFVGGLIDKVAAMDDSQVEMIIKIAAVAAAIGPVLVVLGKVIMTIPKLIGGIKAIGTAFSAVGSLLSANPIVLIIGAIIAVIAIIATVVYKNWDKIKPVLDAIWEKTKEIFGKVKDWIVGAWEKIKTGVQKGVEAVKGFFEKILNFVKKNWKGILLFLVNPFWGAFKLLYDNCGKFRTFIDNLFNAVKNIINKAWTAVKNGVSTMVSNVKNKFSAFKTAISTAVEKVKSVVSTMVGSVKAKFEAFKSAVGNVLTKVSEFKSKVVSWVQNVKSKVVSALKPIIDKFNAVKTAISNCIDKLSNSKLVKWMTGNYKIGENAAGTNYWKGGLTWVNEKGGEIMNLPRGTQIIPHDKSLEKAYDMGMRKGKDGGSKTTVVSGGTSSNITIPKLADTIVVREDADIDRIAEALAKKLISCTNNYGVVRA